MTKDKIHNGHGACAPVERNVRHGATSMLNIDINNPDAVTVSTFRGHSEALLSCRSLWQWGLSLLPGWFYSAGIKKTRLATSSGNFRVLVWILQARFEELCRTLGTYLSSFCFPNLWVYVSNAKFSGLPPSTEAEKQKIVRGGKSAGTLS